MSGLSSLLNIAKSALLAQQSGTDAGREVPLIREQPPVQILALLHVLRAS